MNEGDGVPLAQPLVLLAQVRGAEAEQLLELAERLVAIGGIGDVDPADPDQGVGHEGAHALVDAGVEVEPGRGRARQGGGA